MNTFDNIKSFISDHWPVNKEDLKRTTMIEEDLKITGDDAVEFIIAYGKRFNVIFRISRLINILTMRVTSFF